VRPSERRSKNHVRIGPRGAGTLAALPLLAAQASCARLSRLKAAPRGDPGAKLLAFDAELAADPKEFARIFVHEIFHFVWLRLGNPRRWSYEALLREEMRAGPAANWAGPRSGANAPSHPAMRERRTRRWREYVCESFCDTAAWMFSGVPAHREYTLAHRFRERRRQWFQESGVTNRISI
jgi:hypothetical protein